MTFIKLTLADIESTVCRQAVHITQLGIKITELENDLTREVGIVAVQNREIEHKRAIIAKLRGESDE